MHLSTRSPRMHLRRGVGAPSGLTELNGAVRDRAKPRERPVAIQEGVNLRVAQLDEHLRPRRLRTGPRHALSLADLVEQVTELWMSSGLLHRDLALADAGQDDDGDLAAAC